MTRNATPRVAVIGAGETGRGWAALTAAAGWSVALFDAATAVVEEARAAVAERVARMERVGLAGNEPARAGLAAFRTSGSLLQAVTDADWVIEAGPAELGTRQRILEQVEQVARMAAVLTSSTPLHHASDLCARLRRPERLLVVDPHPPVELMPVVEVVPGPLTDSAALAEVREWLRRLGRAPVVLNREIAGNVGGRIAAAAWRECLHLVLEGVVTVEDLDLAIAGGPALAWATGGPFLGMHASAGHHELNLHLGSLIGTYAAWWRTLDSREGLDAEEQHRVARAVDRAYAARAPALRLAHQQRLADLLNALPRA